MRQKTFKTKAGTELPLMDLRGKDYLLVAHRIQWFREEHPDWSITTEFIALTENSTTTKATIANENGRILATAHKTEDKKGFMDHSEKSETGAIGRALALVGYGTQFAADDLFEGERLADAPIVLELPQKQKPIPTVKPKVNAFDLNAANKSLLKKLSKEAQLTEEQTKKLTIEVTGTLDSTQWTKESFQALVGELDKRAKAVTALMTKPGDFNDEIPTVLK